MSVKARLSKRLEVGQSLVEFAISLLLLLVLLAGIVDGTRALFNYIALRDAAQEAALYGSTDPTNTNAIIERARASSDVLQDLGPTDYQNCNDSGDPVFVDVQVGSPACMGSGITVTVTYYQFPLTMPFMGAIIGSQTVEISASVTDTILRPPC